jgi:two-component system NtrC family sensor kinase
MGNAIKTKQYPVKELEAERKRAEEALEHQRAYFQQLFNDSPEAIAWLDTADRFVNVNKAFETLFGYQIEEVKGRFINDVVVPEDRTEEASALSRAAFNNKTHRGETVRKRKDGSLVDVSIVGYPIRFGNKLVGACAIYSDITERKRAEAALQAEKNKLQSVVDAMEYGLTIQDMDYNILYQNELLRVIFGDHVGEKCYRVYEGKEKLCDGCPVEKAFRDGKSHTSERRVIIPSGEVTLWENTANPIRDAKGKIVSCLEITRNITELKRVEQALKQSQEKLRTMFESVTDGISVINLKGIITETNQRTVEMHGYKSKGELIDRSAYELVAPQDREKIANCARKAIKEGTLIAGIECTLLRADGSEFPGELSTSVFKDASDNLVGHITITRDITERKRAEKERRELEHRAHLTSRLASIGEMAAGIAHEINNPLTAVIGFAQLVMDANIPDDVKKDIAVIYKEAQRAAEVAKNLLVFARKREPAKQPTDINNAIREVLKLRAYEQKVNNIQVNTRFAPELPEVMADYSQLQQVFLNIIINAESAMLEAHNGGTLTVTTQKVNDTSRVSFTDNGPGIAKENLERVFDPFFTTKEVGKGTGLGLSLCHGIVVQHGGRIYARSKLGKGATFVVELPINAH